MSSFRILVDWGFGLVYQVSSGWVEGGAASQVRRRWCPMSSGRKAKFSACLHDGEEPPEAASPLPLLQLQHEEETDAGLHQRPVYRARLWPGPQCFLPCWCGCLDWSTDGLACLCGRGRSWCLSPIFKFENLDPPGSWAGSMTALLWLNVWHVFTVIISCVWNCLSLDISCWTELTRFWLGPLEVRRAQF